MFSVIIFRVCVFSVRFGFYQKKVTKLNFFFLKKIETSSNRPISVRFFRTKTGSNRFGSVFSVWLGFFDLTRFWLDLARLFRFDLILTRFGSVFSVWFFRFQAQKTETEPVGFFKILIGFFSRFGFFGYFFFQFCRFNRFFGFFKQS